MPDGSEPGPRPQTERDLEDYVRRRSRRAAGKQALEQIRTEVQRMEREERERPKAVLLAALLIALAGAVVFALVYLVYRA